MKPEIDFIRHGYAPRKATYLYVALQMPQQSCDVSVCALLRDILQNKGKVVHLPEQCTTVFQLFTDGEYYAAVSGASERVSFQCCYFHLWRSKAVLQIELLETAITCGNL